MPGGRRRDQHAWVVLRMSTVCMLANAVAALYCHTHSIVFPLAAVITTILEGLSTALLCSLGSDRSEGQHIRHIAEGLSAHARLLVRIDRWLREQPVVPLRRREMLQGAFVYSAQIGRAHV